MSVKTKLQHGIRPEGMWILNTSRIDMTNVASGPKTTRHGDEVLHGFIGIFKFL